MSPLRFPLRALVSRPSAGQARLLAICGLLIAALLAAGSGFSVTHSLSVAEAKRGGEKQKVPATPPPGKTAPSVAAKGKSTKATGAKSGATGGKSKGTGAKSKAKAKPEATLPVAVLQPVAAPAQSSRVAVVPATLPSTAPVSSEPSRGAPRRPSARRPAGTARSRSRKAVRGASAAGSGLAGLPRRSARSAAVPAADRTGGASASPPSDKAESTKDSGSPETVTRTVEDIVEVVPGPVKLAVAGLMLFSAALAGGYAVTAVRARGLARQRADLLQDVGLLQTALLPPVPAVVGALRTSVAYRPSEGPGAGGDFYDALTLPEGKAAFILGDVCGHGRQALARTAFIRYTLRAYLEAGLGPSQALQVAGPVIDEHLGGNFATVVLAVHDPRSGSLTYACAGHPAPIVVGPSRPEPVLAGSSPPIGLALRTGVRQTTVPLPPGSVVCLYTDGLAEARTPGGILGRPRLADILEELGRDATASSLIDRVAAEARLVTDDMATVVLSPTAGVTAGGFREERLELNEQEVDEGLAERFLAACEVAATRRSRAVTEAKAWAGSHGAAVLHVRFGTRGAIVDVLPRNVESIAVVSRARALA